MKYMLLYNAPAASDAAPASTDAPEDGAQCDFEAWVRYEKELKDAGVWVTGEALRDLTTSTTVRVGESGERTVTDGPFAETREVLGGFDIVDVPNLDVALEWAARSPGARGGGSVEVRPVAEFEG